MSSADRPISEVLKDIFGNVQEIIRSEVKLAKTELREELAKSKHAAAWIAAAGLCGLFAIGFILISAFFALLRVVPDWAAAALIAVALGFVGAISSSVGAKRLRTMRQLQSSASATQIKENVKWAKQQAK